jgi:signal transduction histidine kinase
LKLNQLKMLPMADLKTRPLLLIVDDIPENIGLLADNLAKDYDVQFAQSGPKALALMETHIPDLILLDVMMPGMNGFDVFEQLKNNPKWRKVPVIFITAENDSATETKALNTGAVDFISKPINQQVVRARVKTHLTLYQREREYQLLNKTLEMRVLERTQQVEALNAALEERAKQAESANETKRLFLGNMSHELRTPMSAIIGFSDLLQTRTNDPTISEQLSVIRKASRKLSATINEILDFTQISSGQTQTLMSEFSLVELIKSLNELFAEQARAKKLSYNTDIDPRVPDQLIGDAPKLKQVLLNLLSNAVKFTREGNISLQIRPLKTNLESVELIFEVSDTGIGIAPELVDKIFLAFEQGDNSLTRQYGGLGLGLSINGKLIEMMGGHIGVKTELGKGSTFWATLVFMRGQVPQKIAPQLSPLESLKTLNYRPRLLLVDDDFLNQEIFQYILNEANLAFDTANDGVEAVAKAIENTYDLILMDVQMPIMNGLEATLAIHELAGCEHIPVIAISANAFDEDRLRCFEAGMNAFIPKPILPEIFYAELAKWLIKPNTEKVV